MLAGWGEFALSLEPILVGFWGATHPFQVLFLVGIGMFTGATIWVLTSWTYVRRCLVDLLFVLPLFLFFFFFFSVRIVFWCMFFLVILDSF